MGDRRRDTRKVDLRALARESAKEGADEPTSAPSPISGDIPLTHVPHVVMSAERMMELPIDPRQAFLLSRIDGTLTVEEVLDVCGFERVEAIELLASFAQKGVIVLVSRRGGSRTER